MADIGDRAAPHAAPARNGGAVRMLRLLLAGSVLVPSIVLVAAGFLTWRSTVERARADLAQDVAIAREQATKVLDTHQLVALRVNDLVGNLDDGQIRTREKELHDQLVRELASLPQVRSVIVFGSDGHALLSSRIYPVDRTIDYRDRDAFAYLSDPNHSFHISGIRTGEMGGAPFFALARRKERIEGSFDGVIGVTVSPDYFLSFYAKLIPNDEDYTASLVRDDGVTLVRFPGSATQTFPGAHGEFLLNAIKTEPEAGFFETRSVIDGAARLVAYHRLETYPLYVTQGRSWGSIVREWRDILLPFVAIAGAAMAAFVLLALLALRRTQREEAALARAQAEMRRREIVETALRHAQKMEAVGQLTGGIAHDFNNLLTVVIGNLETLRRRLAPDDGERHRLIDSAIRGAMRGANLTQKLLAFSRRQPLDPVEIDLNTLVADMSDMLRRTLGETIAVEIELSPDLWRSYADANQLESALLNLAVNARDAMPRGGRLRIATTNTHLDAEYCARHEEVVPGDYVVVEVSDTGSGMSREVLVRAFEPFFTTKPVGQGTGLGLSQVYGFVKQSGGHVQIDSIWGQGTTVRLYLPRLTEEFAAVA